MSNHLISIDARGAGAVQARLQHYLPGLDVHLLAVDEHRALLREHLVHALQLAYPDGEAAEVMRASGILHSVPVSEDQTVALTELRDPVALGRKRASGTVPPDDWHLHSMRLPAAWDLFGGPDAIAWQGVVVGHIDTGYRVHPVFGFPQVPWLDTVRARTFVPPPPEQEATLFPDEPGGGVDNMVGVFAGHGTRTASALCGCAPDAHGRMFHGAAPRVPLVPVRISGSVWINDRQDEFAQAMGHLLGVPDLGVVSISLGIFGATLRPVLRRAIDRAYEAGVIVVCAAGNYVNSVVAPARLPRTFAVGGVTAADLPWSGSAFGPTVDVSAPASGLPRASVSGSGKPLFLGKDGDGTSYATAATAGIAALWLLLRRQELSLRYPQGWQRVEAFRRIARTTARRPPGWQDGAFGSGIIDAHALLTAPLPEAAALHAAAAS